jgi:hypothetical protein
MMEDEGPPAAIGALPAKPSAALVQYRVRAEILVIRNRALPADGSLPGRLESAAGRSGPAGGEDRHWSDRGL